MGVIAPVDYSVNLSLIGSKGQVIAQYAGPPQGTFGAMSRWQPGVTERDNHALAIPPDTPPGDYELRVVVYDWRNGKPLPVRASFGDLPHAYRFLIRISVAP